MRIFLSVIFLLWASSAFGGVVFVDPSSEFDRSFKGQLTWDLKKICPQDFERQSYTADSYFLVKNADTYHITVEGLRSEIKFTYRKQQRKYELKSFVFLFGECR